MKIDRKETHDRYEHFVNQDMDIGKTVQSIINQRPFGEYPFYIFAHTRTLGFDEKQAMFREDMLFGLSNPMGYTRKYKSIDQVPEKRLIWQPRLTKPKAQTNSMLFKVNPGSDQVKVIWMIPEEGMWSQYKKGNITESDVVAWSIHQYKTNKEGLEQPEKDDLPDWQIDSIYKELSQQALASKQASLVASSEPLASEN